MFLGVVMCCWTARSKSELGIGLLPTRSILAVKRYCSKVGYYSTDLKSPIKGHVHLLCKNNFSFSSLYQSGTSTPCLLFANRGRPGGAGEVEEVGVAPNP